MYLRIIGEKYLVDNTRVTYVQCNIRSLYAKCLGRLTGFNSCCVVTQYGKAFKSFNVLWTLMYSCELIETIFEPIHEALL